MIKIISEKTQKQKSVQDKKKMLFHRRYNEMLNDKKSKIYFFDDEVTSKINSKRDDIAIFSLQICCFFFLSSRLFRLLTL